MKTVLRLFLTFGLCVAFLALVGAMTAGTRFGLPDYLYSHGLWQTFAVAGGIVALFAALLAPNWLLKQRLLLALGGAILGVASGSGVGLLINEHSTRLEVLGLISLWGIVLGAWLGRLHRATVAGFVVGLLLFAYVAGGALFIEHPDPAALLGALGGLVAFTFLCHAEHRRRLLGLLRFTTVGLFVLTGVSLVLLMPRFWPRTMQYTLEARDSGFRRTAVCSSPDGKRVITSMRYGIYLCSIEDGRVIQQLPTQNAIVSAVRFPADDRPISVTIDRFGVLTSWNAHSGKQDTFILDGRPREFDSLKPYFLALSPDGRRVAVMIPSVDRILWDVDLEKGKQQRISLPTSYPVTALAWIDGERLLLGCERDGKVHVVRLAEKGIEMLQQLETPLGQRGQLMVSPDRLHFCVFNQYTSPPYLVRLKDGDRQTLGESTARTDIVRFSKYGGTFLYWADNKDAVHVWDVAGKREIACYRQHHTIVGEWLRIRSRDVAGLAVCADERTVISASPYGDIRVWEMEHELP